VGLLLLLLLLLWRSLLLAGRLHLLDRPSP
jgi:hypothetical protein